MPTFHDSLTVYLDDLIIGDCQTGTAAIAVDTVEGRLPLPLVWTSLDLESASVHSPPGSNTTQQ